MTEIKGTISAKSPCFASANNKKKEKPEGFNPEYAELLNVNGKVIKIEKSDEVLSENIWARLKANLKQTSKLPEYTAKGLKGDKNANFFEFLQLGKIPYWIGGSMLVGCFLAGGKKAKPLAKEIAAGVAFYYVADKAAKALIDVPVRFFKGIDLNRKYKDIIALKTESKDGHSDKKTEYHNVYESIDFTRWDLLYNEDSEAAQNPDLVNSEYDKLALNMGLAKDLKDPDSTIKPYIKKIIVASRASKSAMIIPLAALSAGLSKYEGWQTWGKGIGRQFKNAINAETFSKKIKGLTAVVKDHFIDDIGNSFKDLWSGKSLGKSRFHSLLGKAVIIAPVAATIAANLNIIRLSYIKEDKYIDSSSPPATAALRNSYNSFVSRMTDTITPKKENEYTF